MLRLALVLTAGLAVSMAGPTGAMAGSATKKAVSSGSDVTRTADGLKQRLLAVSGSRKHACGEGR